eukprot:CAMPEP_0172185212 /NCGR_PEP_ID=MMETSP1050-20130122/20034_1 /TAXON_ID=233186 /ORGANISM="Cryptomonas curvata, Strain CCAP979/52" /LENGTH=157 /DNA_ID=CAMNT_0012859153 /DNA_START=1 /DNA_END=474 /DNA_ORIENTATION=+
MTETLVAPVCYQSKYARYQSKYDRWSHQSAAQPIPPSPHSAPNSSTLPGHSSSPAGTSALVWLSLRRRCYRRPHVSGSRCICAACGSRLPPAAASPATPQQRKGPSSLWSSEPADMWAVASGSGAAGRSSIGPAAWQSRMEQRCPSTTHQPLVEHGR